MARPFRCPSVYELRTILVFIFRLVYDLQMTISFHIATRGRFL